MDTVRPLFVSTYPPEACGLATFTRDSADAVDIAAPEPVSSVGRPSRRRGIFASTTRAWSTSSTTAARTPTAWPRKWRTTARATSISLQHEFGLYPGEWGSDVLKFVRKCRKPIVTTFHTLLHQHLFRQLQILGLKVAQHHRSATRSDAPRSRAAPHPRASARRQPCASPHPEPCESTACARPHPPQRLQRAAFRSILRKVNHHRLLAVQHAMPTALHSQPRSPQSPAEQRRNRAALPPNAPA